MSWRKEVNELWDTLIEEGVPDQTLQIATHLDGYRTEVLQKLWDVWVTEPTLDPSQWDGCERELAIMRELPEHLYPEEASYTGEVDPMTLAVFGQIYGRDLETLEDILYGLTAYRNFDQLKGASHASN